MLMVRGARPLFHTFAGALVVALALAIAPRSFAVTGQPQVPSPVEAERSFVRGNRHLDRGEYAEALAAYHEAIRLGADGAEHHAQLALAYRFVGDYAKAEESLRRALARDSKNPAYLGNLGVIYEHTGRFRLAEETYHRVLSRAPDLPGTHLNLGNVLRWRKRYEEAARSYRRFLMLVANSPLFPMASYKMGQIYGLLGHAEKSRLHFGAAAGELEAALALGPEPPESRAHYFLGQALRRLGEIEGADAAFREHLRMNPPQAALGYYGLACLAFRADDAEKGKALLPQALSPSPYRRLILLEMSDEPDLDAVRGEKWFLDLQRGP
jgi:tetratricopeptide (TPR) repeat protein